MTQRDPKHGLAKRLDEAEPADLGLSPTTDDEDDDLRADGRGGSQPGTRLDQVAAYMGVRKGVVRSCGRCSHTLVGDADAPCPNCGSDGDA